MTDGTDGDLRRRSRTWLEARVRRAVRADPVGCALFFGALTFFGLTWQVGSFSPAVDTLARTLGAVADGRLHIGPAGGDPRPATGVAGGSVHGRNYGQVVLALPALWTLTAATAVADASVVVVTAWAGAAAGFVVSAGELLDRRERATRLGGATVAGLWVAQVITAPPLDADIRVLALQASSAVAAALVGVAAYRVVRRLHDRRVGALAGGAVVLATPVGFWATVPLRHGLAALLVLLSVWSFVRSRDAVSPRAAARFRALAYVPVGLAAWVHPLEGLVLLAALLPVDVLTARSNRPRALGAVGVALAASLVPFLATNALVTGHPLIPPRALPASAGGTWPVPIDGGVPTVAAGVLAWFARRLLRGVAALGDGGRLYAVFVRSTFTRTPIVYQSLGPVDLKVHGAPVALSVLEAAPLVAGLVVAPIAARDRLLGSGVDGESAGAGDAEGAVDDGGAPHGQGAGAEPAVDGGDPADGAGVDSSGLGVDWRDFGVDWRDPRVATDALVVGYVVVLVLASLPELPANASVTVRQFLPAVPLAVVLLAQLAVVRAAVRERWRTIGRAYVGLVVVGGPAFVLLASALVDGPHAVAQLNALLSFAAAAVLAYAAGVASLLEGYERALGLALAGAAATTTTFVLLAPLLYLPYGRGPALPIARFVAEALAAL